MSTRPSFLPERKVDLHPHLLRRVRDSNPAGHLARLDGRRRLVTSRSSPVADRAFDGGSNPERSDRLLVVVTRAGRPHGVGSLTPPRAPALSPRGRRIRVRGGGIEPMPASSFCGERGGEFDYLVLLR